MMNEQQKRDEDQDVDYRVLVGSAKGSDYAQVSFLVPSERIDELAMPCKTPRNLSTIGQSTKMPS